MRAALAALALAGFLAGPALAGSVLAGPALAGEGDGRLRVIGRAHSETAPDFAAVEIGVEARGATPAAALDAASRAARGIVGTAKALAVGEADIGTSSLSLQPSTTMVRRPDGTMHDEAAGYTAANRVQVRLADMARLGELMRQALDAGANRIEGVSFGLRDPGAAGAAVQVAALKDARAQAERLAEAAGVRLGAVLSIDSAPRREAGPPMPFAARAAAPKGGRAVPVEAGSIETSAEVEAVFAITP